MTPARTDRRSDQRLIRGRRFDVSLRGDPRNADYPMQAAPNLPIVSKVWECPVRLDQGREGACVGYAGAHFYGSEDRIQPITKRLAKRFYKKAQKHDQWPGENYSGTSVNGLLKYLRSQNLVGEYRWVMDLDTLKRTLAYHGPVIVGCEWREGMARPNAAGYISFSGEVVGGHATCWRGIDTHSECFIIQQSWGRDHGVDGVVRLPFADAAELLLTGPQICFPQKRALQPLSRPPKKWWQFWK